MHDVLRALNAAFEMYGGRPEDRPTLGLAMQRLLCEASVARLGSEPGAADGQPELSESFSKARDWLYKRRDAPRDGRRIHDSMDTLFFTPVPLAPQVGCLLLLSVLAAKRDLARQPCIRRRRQLAHLGHGHGPHPRCMWMLPPPRRRLRRRHCHRRPSGICGTCCCSGGGRGGRHRWRSSGRIRVAKRSSDMRGCHRYAMIHHRASASAVSSLAPPWHLS